MAAQSEWSRSKRSVNTVISAWEWLKSTAAQERNVNV